MNRVKGTDLPLKLQREVLNSYVHRYTRDHVPSWSRKEWKDGKTYPLQFDSDQDWLEHTFFWVTNSGKLSNRPSYCYSTPTWPDNPELRKDHSHV